MYNYSRVYKYGLYVCVQFFGPWCSFHEVTVNFLEFLVI